MQWWIHFANISFSIALLYIQSRSVSSSVCVCVHALYPHTILTQEYTLTCTLWDQTNKQYHSHITKSVEGHSSQTILVTQQHNQDPRFVSLFWLSTKHVFSPSCCDLRVTRGLPQPLLSCLFSSRMEPVIFFFFIRKAKVFAETPQQSFSYVSVVVS